MARAKRSKKPPRASIFRDAGEPSAAQVGFAGTAYERLPTGAIGSPIAGVSLQFLKEDRSARTTVISDAQGEYQVDVDPGHYLITARHKDFEDFTSAPAFFMVPAGGGYKDANVFLRAPRVTTVLVVRHAEPGTGSDALRIPEGVDRARKLAFVAYKAGVSAIFTDNTLAAKATAEPLATLLGATITPYSTPSDVASRIGAEHAGDVVLVVCGESALLPIVEAVSGQDLYADDPPATDFDTLLVVGKHVAGGAVSVVNLQYGAPSGPELESLSRSQTTTVLLVRHAEPSALGLSPAGQARATELVHVAEKAGITSVYVPPSSVALATALPLTAALGTAVEAYDESDLPALASAVRSLHEGESVLVVAGGASLWDVVHAFGGSPLPVVQQNEHDDLIVLFLSAAGDARAVNLQYGQRSP